MTFLNSFHQFCLMYAKINKSFFVGKLVHG